MLTRLPSRRARPPRGSTAFASSYIATQGLTFLSFFGTFALFVFSCMMRFPPSPAYYSVVSTSAHTFRVLLSIAASAFTAWGLAAVHTHSGWALYVVGIAEACCAAAYFFAMCYDASDVSSFVRGCSSCLVSKDTGLAVADAILLVLLAFTGAVTLRRNAQGKAHPAGGAAGLEAAPVPALKAGGKKGGKAAGEPKFVSPFASQA